MVVRESGQSPEQSPFLARSLARMDCWFVFIRVWGQVKWNLCKGRILTGTKNTSLERGELKKRSIIFPKLLTKQ